MDAVKFLKEKSRMCKNMDQTCKDCPLSSKNNKYHKTCGYILKYYGEESVAIVEKWSADHPAKRRQNEFLKMFPNVKFSDGVIDIPPCLVDTKIKENCGKLGPCLNCRKEYWLAEE